MDEPASQPITRMGASVLILLGTGSSTASLAIDSARRRLATAGPDRLWAARLAAVLGLLVLAPASLPLATAEESIAVEAANTSPTPEAEPESDQTGLYAQPVLVLDPGMHTARISRADLDRAGRLAVTGSHDKTVRLWALDGDLAEPEATWRLPAGPGNVGRIDAVAMAPAGDLIAAGGWATPGPPTHIYLFAREGRLVQRIGGLPQVVKHLSFSPDGRWLAAGLHGRNGIRVYDRAAGWAEAARDTNYGDDVYGLTFAADGRLATTSYDGQVRLYHSRLLPAGARFRPIAQQPMTAGDRPFGIAFHPDGARFVLGTEWMLRAFDAFGEPLWHRAAPSIVWAVNITGDGRLAVAAYGDGTIRWHRLDDGRELLALFPMIDRKNWIAWTPEGFYGATPGAHGVLRWHVNRGWDRPADAYPVSQFRYLRRPDALPLVLQEGETARALGLADMSRARREVQRITKAALPPAPAAILRCSTSPATVP